MLFSTPSCVALAFFYATAAATVLRLPITDHFSDAWTVSENLGNSMVHLLILIESRWRRCNAVP
jgi:hypothetical protein